MDASVIQTLTVYALPVLFAIALHEAAHGYVARWFGDNTAYLHGRVTLNPIKHIDLIGTILMPVLLYLATSGSFIFGYAKPVPVVSRNLRNPRWHSVWVSLAGCACNFVQAFIWAILGILLRHVFDYQEPFFLRMTEVGLQINVLLCMFNLFPLPPLDGGRALMMILPIRQALGLARIEPYGFFIVLLLVVTGLLGRFWLYPMVDFGYSVLGILLAPFVFLVT